jgi:hypothetical protein
MGFAERGRRALEAIFHAEFFEHPLVAFKIELARVFSGS